ncbi:putative disease resistance protein RGA3 [Miscanthus floridulus]|uniref:putative disease resistance protein RGA3 n=1 Tax=Miscanthus floridulus TaxID=154761 RepID=UPI0034588D39
MQRWVRKLKDAMYDATDILDLCHLQADKHKESKCGSMEEKASGCLQPLLFCLRNPLFAHKIESRIKELNQRLEGIHKEADKYKFNISIGLNPEPRRLTAAELSNYKTSSHFDESSIVGEQIERDTTELVQVLTTDDKNHDIKVVSIIGTGGMGKTTLAQNIFNEATIQEHFKMKIWLSINKQFDEAELLRTAIKHAGGNHGGEQDKTTLTDTLINTLSTKGRFLLVMDDVWSHKAWNDVLSVPVRTASKKQSGSRILVTTRSVHLPRQMQATLHQHRGRPLGNDDAWSLLKRQLQPDQMARTKQTPRKRTIMMPTRRTRFTLGKCVPAHLVEALRNQEEEPPVEGWTAEIHYDLEGDGYYHPRLLALVHRYHLGGTIQYRMEHWTHPDYIDF